MTWAGNVTHRGEMRNAYNILVRKLEGKRPLRRPRHRQEDNIRMDMKEVGCERVDAYGSCHGPVVGSCHGK
jgi:hypothetical protein